MRRKNGSDDMLVSGDIIEIKTAMRLLWITRVRFNEIVTMSNMLEAVIEKDVEMSTIRYIFDDAEDFKEVSQRFNAWKNDEFKKSDNVVSFAAGPDPESEAQ